MTTPRERLAALPSLSAGGHEHVDEGACFMEAVAYVAGEPWSDKPACACPVLGTFMRDLFVSLSGPMTAAHGYRVEDNVAAGLRVFFDCVARGIPALSPHAIGAFPTTWAIDRPQWLAYDCAVIDHCTHVLLLPRWETSAGAVAERAYAVQIGTPVITSLEELKAT